MSTLYIVGTPIGNLEDISLRALRILGEADFILCEDTRTTKKLLDHYKIKTLTISYHQHSDESKMNEIIKLLSQGKNLAYVSEAGTPGISDPGGMLIQKVMEKIGDRVQIESVPGPSAVTAALSISGIPTDKFVFMGFPPHKKGRQKFLSKILASEFPVVVYESKYRVIRFLEELDKLAKSLSSDKSREDIQISNFSRYARSGKARQFPISLATRDLVMATPDLLRSETKPDKSKIKNIKKLNPTSVVVARELTKMHETVYRGKLENIIEKIKSSPDDQRGEFVVIIGK